MSLRTDFEELLRTGSKELFHSNPDRMRSGELLSTHNVIAESDLELFFEGLDAGLVTIHHGGRFNTRDRPVPGDRWSLLSRAAGGGWYNAEYLPQIAAYVEAISRLGYPHERVLFELNPISAFSSDPACARPTASRPNHCNSSLRFNYPTLRSWVSSILRHSVCSLPGWQ